MGAKTYHRVHIRECDGTNGCVVRYDNLDFPLNSGFKRLGLVLIRNLRVDIASNLMNGKVNLEYSGDQICVHVL